MPTVTQNGVSFHVQVLGQGPPVVMLHGLLLGSLASWYFTVAPALATRNTVLLFDLRGHGRSERTRAGYDVGTMAGDLHALTQDTFESPMTLVGHSYGGLVALRFALTHPERVRRLVLVETPVGAATLADFQAMFELGPEGMLDALPESVRATVARGKRQAVRMVEGLRALLFETDLMKDLATVGELTDSELRGLQCPVSCLYGTRSSCLQDGRRLSRVIANAQLKLLPGGHYLHLDAPAQISQYLCEVL